jgi:hypothetical protein
MFTKRRRDHVMRRLVFAEDDERLADLDHRRLLVACSHGLVHSDAAGVHTSVLLDGAWLLGSTK